MEKNKMIQQTACDKKCAHGDCVTPSSMVWLFAVGSVIGFVLEGFWSILRLGYWENHSAVVWGPFCIVYGVGTAMMYWVSAQIANKPILLQFAIFALTGGAIEYLASWLQETVFGVSTWNYDDHFLNIGGRISLQMVIIWGLLGTAFAHFVFPLFARLLEKMQGRWWTFSCVCLASFMVLNLLMSAVAILRWGERKQDIPASNRFESFLDDSYGDDRMESIFSNMEFLK